MFGYFSPKPLSKTTMKKALLLLLTALSFCICKAQQNFQPGYVILADGTRKAGLIILNDEEPWYNQRRIWMKDSAEYAANPAVKPKKYIADDLKLFQVGPRIFDKVHYVDMENLQLKSLGSNDHMMERLSIGRINAHRYYQYPKDFDGFMGTKDEFEKWKAKKKNDLLIGFKILSQKDDEKLENAFDYDLQKYFNDTPDVLTKYQNGGYGNEPVVKKGGGLAAKMMAMARKAAFKPQEADAIVMAFNDYNQKNPVKK